MSRSLRKGATQTVTNQIRPFSPNLTFKTDQLENAVLQPYQDKAELQYLRFELQQEKAKTQQLELQLQYEINQRVQNEQLYQADVASLRELNEELKLRCAELEIKVRENSVINQDSIRDASSKIALLSIEVERLNQLSQRRLIENEQLQRQLDQKSLAQELQTIQKIVEELRNELLLKQKTIHYLQDQLQIQTTREASNQTSHFSNQAKNIEQLVNQVNQLTQILEDKDMQLQANKAQFDGLYMEFTQLSQFNRQCNEENKNYKIQLDACYREIERLNRVLIQRNQELHEAENQDWKRNFQEINERYHKVQEQLCLAQAELEASRATQRLNIRQSDK